MCPRLLRAIVLVAQFALIGPTAGQDKAAPTKVVVDQDKKTITFDPKTCTSGGGYLTWGLGHYEVKVLGHADGKCKFIFVLEGEMAETHYLVGVPIDSGPVTIRSGKTLGSLDTSFPLDKATVVRRCIGGRLGLQEVRVGETDAFVRFGTGDIPRSEMRPKAGDSVKFLCRVYDGPDFKSPVPSKFTYPTAEFVVGASGDWLWLETAMEEMTVGDRRQVQVPAKAAPGVRPWLPDGVKAETLHIEIGLLAVTPGDDRPLADRLEALLPHAAGVALVTVAGTKDVDRRAGDGPLVREVRWKTVRGSGTLRDGVSITLAPGGHPPPPAAVRPARPDYAATVDTFKTGEQYWVAFRSDTDRFPQRIMTVWPEKDAPKLLDEAVRRDHYAHRPQYDPRIGLTYSHRAGKDKTGWQVRIERDRRTLWEVRLPGEKAAGEWRLFYVDEWNTLRRFGRTTISWLLLAETQTALTADNPYRLPAGEFQVTYLLDAETGKTAGVRARAEKAGHPSVHQYYDLASGKLRQEERYDSLKAGGRAAGADTEEWLRKTVRTYDPATGRMTGETVYRFLDSPEETTYVPVKSK